MDTYKIKIAVFIILSFLVLSVKNSFCEIYYGRIFKGTFYPLDVYYIKGKEKGPTVMVQGGIQGDETSGILTAQLLIGCQLKKGNLIVVPRANPHAILLRRRGINVDLNRRFDKDYGKFYEDFLARAIKYLASLSDALIHLHEGSGFYSPYYISPLRNPFRYGQSIIIDTSTFRGNICLASLATKVLNRINSEISPANFSFSLFNMNTLSSTTRYPEQRKSFTYYVIKKLNKPAFAVEVSKNIANIKWKVTHQLKTVIELLSELGVTVVPPKDILKFVDKELSKKPYIKLKDLDVDTLNTLNVRLPDIIRVKVKDKFPLRWSATIKNYPFVNISLFRFFLLNNEPFINIIDDGRKIKKIRIRYLNKRCDFGSASPLLLYSLDNKIMVATPEEEIVAKEGQTLLLFGVLDKEKKQVINAKGIVTNPVKNDGQDLGRPILLYKNRFIKRYIHLFKNGWSFYLKYKNRGLRWKVKVFYNPIKKRAMLYGNSLVFISEGQKEISMFPGKYKFLPFQNSEIICFVDKNPIPIYSKEFLTFKGKKHYIIRFFNAKDFSFLWEVKIKVL